jgi:hypothetical protein
MPEEECAIFRLLPESKNKKIHKKTYHCYSKAFENANQSDFISIYELEYSKKHTDYTVINYDKTAFCFNESLLVRQCRSVILTHPEGRLLSFSFPKSLTPEYFFSKYQMENAVENCPSDISDENLNRRRGFGINQDNSCENLNGRRGVGINQDNSDENLNGRRGVGINQDNSDENLNGRRGFGINQDNSDENLNGRRGARGLESSFAGFGRPWFPPFANEKIEGTLIHLFYDYRISQWEIATKRAVGGVYHLFHYKKKEISYKKTKVRDMFLDALRMPRKTNFSELRILDGLSRDNSYSFILQHPENPIVFPIERPALYLIGVFSILTVSNIAISISPTVYETWPCFRDIPVIQFPKRYTGNYRDYFSGASNYSISGIVVQNFQTGEHCVIANPLYEKMLKWRENSNINVLQYQYLALRRIGKTADFLVFFPKYKDEFGMFFADYKQFVVEIHGYYMSKYVRKERTQISGKYLYFVDDLHKSVYLRLVNARIGGEKPKMTRAMVFEYFNKMEPEQLLYVLNYDQRALF